jgi:hypothetical protein
MRALRECWRVGSVVESFLAWTSCCRRFSTQRHCLPVLTMNATLWRPRINEAIEQEILKRVMASPASCQAVMLSPVGSTCPALVKDQSALLNFFTNVSASFRVTTRLQNIVEDALANCWFSCANLAFANEVRLKNKRNLCFSMIV